MTLPQPKPAAAFRKHVLALIGENYGDKTVCLCPTAFVRIFTGDHQAAILLSQILYWADKTSDPDGWFYKSFAQWSDELGLSEFQVRRILNGDPRVQSQRVTLRDLGIETVVKKVKRTGAPTMHFRVNQAQLLAALERLLGQGNPEQCQGSTLNNVGNEPSAESGMNSEQSVPSLINLEITNPKISAEDHDHQNPAHHPDEDSGLEIFFSFEVRFGSLKERFHEPFRAELARLGAAKVGDVLDRCATRGRSWVYVEKALANEQSVAASTEFVTDWGVETDTGSDDENTPFAQLQEAAPALFISDRVAMAWVDAGEPTATAQTAWAGIYYQLEMQLDRGSFEAWVRGATLVDFEPETRTFLIVVRTAYAQTALRSRLDRMVKRIASDICGQPVEVLYLLQEEWRLRESGGEDAAIA